MDEIGHLIILKAEIKEEVFEDERAENPFPEDISEEESNFGVSADPLIGRLGFENEHLPVVKKELIDDVADPTPAPLVHAEGSSRISFQVTLAEAVEKRPCLYDFKLKEYTNREKVQSAWEAVAKEVNNSVKGCKETWRNMRIVFTRTIKTPPSGSKAKKKWPLLNTMMFLKSFVIAKGNDLPHQSLDEEKSSVVGETPKEAILREEEEGTKRENVTTSDEFEPMGPPPKKNRRSKSTIADNVLDRTSKTKASEDTPRKLFLMSLLPDIEEMTPAQFKNFRRDVVDLIARVND